MDSGVAYFPAHYGLDPAAIARLVEERGHRWLFFPEHTHIPASRETPYPAGGELPRKYSHTYDLFVSLTAAALATRGLRVGSGICLLIERDPITTAKEVASIDHLSGGRFEFGVGAGWNREEMANHGTDPRRRMAVMAERVKAMKSIWTQQEASFRGSMCASSESGRGQSPLSVLIRRSSWVATARRCWTGCWTSATPGCPTTPMGLLSASRGSAEGPSRQVAKSL